MRWGACLVMTKPEKTLENGRKMARPRGAGKEPLFHGELMRHGHIHGWKRLAYATLPS